MRTRTLVRGFTLIEMLVTIAISSLLMIGAAALVITMFSQGTIRRTALNSVDQVRFTGDDFANEVRDAQPGADGSHAVAEASTSEVVVYSPYGIGSTTTVKRFRYFVSNGTLYRGVTTPTGSPLAYDLANEVVTPVVNNLVSTSTPVFTYYDGSYAGTSTPLTQPVNLTDVRFIQMNLDVEQQNTRTSTTTFTYTAGASIRSLKTNLGN